MTQIFRRAACTSVLALGFATSAAADCGNASDNATILGNDFPALQAVVEGARA